MGSGYGNSSVVPEYFMRAVALIPLLSLISCSTKEEDSALTSIVVLDGEEDEHGGAT